MGVKRRITHDAKVFGLNSWKNGVRIFQDGILIPIVMKMKIIMIFTFCSTVVRFT